MEATGIYYLDLAMELAAAGLPVSVINPKSFHNFAKLMLKNSKTDAIDAQLLADYGERMSPRLWTPPTAIQLELRAIGRHINRLTCHRTRAKNELHALKATQTTLTMLIEDEEEAIEAFDKRIERFRLAGRALIDNCPTLSAQFGHMIAAPGMGEISVFAALAELTTLPVTLKSAQVSRHAGLDVRYSDKIYVNDLNSDTAPSYTVAGANVGYHWKMQDWAVNTFARVDNLFDKDYSGSVIVNESNSRFFEPAEGRNWSAGLSVTKEF